MKKIGDDWLPDTYIETQGSQWIFNIRKKIYLRLPLNGPRSVPEWSNESAGWMQDNIWHPYDKYFFCWNCPDFWSEDEDIMAEPHLHIIAKGVDRCRAPKAQLIFAGNDDMNLSSRVSLDAHV